MEKYYSNEIVFRGHPDKVCDQISDAILDECLKQDENSRCGIETVGGKGKIFITGEITTKAKLDIESIVKGVLKDIGYDYDCEIINNIGIQSPDIALGTNDAVGGAGDNVCSACRSNVQGQEKTENQREELQESSRYIQSVCQRVFPCDIGSVNGRYRNGRNKPCKVDCVRRNVLCRAYATSAKNNEVCNEASTQSGRQEI